MPECRPLRAMVGWEGPYASGNYARCGESPRGTGAPSDRSSGAARILTIFCSAGRISEQEHVAAADPLLDDAKQGELRCADLVRDAVGLLVVVDAGPLDGRRHGAAEDLHQDQRVVSGRRNQANPVD